MPTKVWRRRPTPPLGFAKSLGTPPFQAHLLYNRGIRSREELDAYLAADLRLAADPMLLPDMGKAVARLRRALSTGEMIGAFGDFDTDGVTGTALLVQALGELGSRVVPYLPDRVDEGHGLNVEAIKSLRARGVSLLVTVDCGVSSIEEVKLASSLGIDTIITDHHSLPSSVPDALAIVNSKRPDSSYPFRELTGVGLSFKLVEALWAALGRARPDQLLELVALGTVADVGPLTGENRHLVKWGLDRLNETRNVGLRALVASSKLRMGSLDTDSLSFGLIPRLNAAGRLGDANLSLDLLTATSPEAAERIAEELESRNNERRLLTAQGLAQSLEQLKLQLQTVPSIIIVQHKEWLPGILGLIAGNLSERFYRPAVAISMGEQVSRASARSIPEFDIIEALQRSRGLFHRFGGHPQAAGFTMPTSHLTRLKNDLITAADERMGGTDLVPAIEVDCEISPALLNDHNFGFIEALRPFGEGNPAPVFLTRNAMVESARQVGKQRDHLKMRIAHGGRTWEAIAFGQGDSAAAAGARVDLVYTVGLNDWAAVNPCS